MWVVRVCVTRVGAQWKRSAFSLFVLWVQELEHLDCIEFLLATNIMYLLIWCESQELAEMKSIQWTLEQAKQLTTNKIETILRKVKKNEEKRTSKKKRWSIYAVWHAFCSHFSTFISVQRWLCRWWRRHRQQQWQRQRWLFRCEAISTKDANGMW